MPQCTTSVLDKISYRERERESKSREDQTLKDIIVTEKEQCKKDKLLREIEGEGGSVNMS